MDAAIVRGFDLSLETKLKDGAYVLAIGTPELALRFRLTGFQIQDSLALFMPGPTATTAFLLRKPLGKFSITERVAQDGVGALCIDGCRVPGKAQVPWGRIRSYRVFDNQARDSQADQEAPAANPLGRWPVNVLFVHAKGCRKVGIDADDVPLWECSGAGCPVRHLEEPRFFWQFADPGEMIEWLRRLITPPERDCFVSV